MKHRAVIIGAGRIGAGYNWHDDAYTHAGAFQALKDRVELVGFIEPDFERALSAKAKWHVPVYEELESLTVLKPDIVSICTQPDKQEGIFEVLSCIPGVKGVWCEKPLMSRVHIVPTQVNYMRRGDPLHRSYRDIPLTGFRLVVYGKDDIHTKCHFEDLAQWWGVPLDYRPFNGPCAYILAGVGNVAFFDNGGVDGGICFKAMLNNLLDHIDSGTPLWSPAR
jgi:hypothetical protein